MNHKHTLRQSILVFIAVAVLAGCSESGGDTTVTPVVQVAVIAVKPEQIALVRELPGRIAPTRLAEVRARVSGILIERVFDQGSQIRKGDVLYRIDPSLFEVRVESARAVLARAEAGLLQTRQSEDRQKKLQKSNVTSIQNLDDAVAKRAQAEAEVAAARASLREAEINLDHTSVTAPISGRIGRALLTEGALVSENGADNLATINQLDPIYADFTQPAADLHRLRSALQDGKLMTAPDEARVQLLLDDGSPYPMRGRLLFSEVAVDSTTGQVTLRGEFPNPDGDLLPGMYVRVRIEQGVQRDALAVPQQAVQRDGGGQASVLIVNADNKVEQRPVKVGRAIGDRFVIDSGLTAGVRVVAEGFQKVRPGATVAPSVWDAHLAATKTVSKEAVEPELIDR